MLLHVPVQRGALATLIAADFTSDERQRETRRKKTMGDDDERLWLNVVFMHFFIFHNVYGLDPFSASVTHWSGVSPVCVRLWTSR